MHGAGGSLLQKVRVTVAVHDFLRDLILLQLQLRTVSAGGTHSDGRRVKSGLIEFKTAAFNRIVVDIARKVQVFALNIPRFDMCQVIIVILDQHFTGFESSLDGKIAANRSISCRFQRRYTAEGVAVYADIIEFRNARHGAVFDIDAVDIRPAASVITDIGRFLFLFVNAIT